MKRTLPLLCALVLTVSLPACGGPPPGEPEPAAAGPSGASGTAAPDAAPQVGDRIGQSDAERAEARKASIAEQAAENARRQEESRARGATEIGWEDLMPEGEEERLAQMYQSQMAMLYGGGGVAEGSAADAMVQIGTFNTVKEMDGKTVRLPGYTVPFEYGSQAEITEFLLVPYFGACIHAPPPPPNQTVFVSTEKPIKLKDLDQAVWVEGVLHAETAESDLADAAYTIELTHIEKYEY